MEQHLKPTTQSRDPGPDLSPSCLAEDKEKVGELCHQLPQRDPEPAGLPTALAGYHQLRMQAAVWVLAAPGGDGTTYLFVALWTMNGVTSSAWTVPLPYVAR